MKRKRARRFQKLGVKWFAQVWAFLPNLQTALMAYYAQRSSNGMACGECGSTKSLILTKTDGARTERRGTGRLISILNTLPDDVGIRCRSCRSRAARRAGPRRSSERFRRSSPAVARPVQASAPRPTEPAALPPAVIRVEPKPLAAEVPAQRGRFDLGIVEVEKRWRWESGKMVMPPEREGWDFVMDDGSEWTLIDTATPYQRPVPRQLAAA